MLKKTILVMLAASFMFFTSGCALLSTALSAAAAYGLYQATKD